MDGGECRGWVDWLASDVLALTFLWISKVDILFVVMRRWMGEQCRGWVYWLASDVLAPTFSLDD